MSLDLHAACKERLISFLEESLPAVLVENRQYLTWESVGRLGRGDSILPKAGPIRESLDKFAEDDVFLEFTRDRISRGLAESETWVNEAQPKPLPEHNGFADVRRVATTLVRDFESLPWAYAFTTRLPDVIAPQLADGLGELIFEGPVRLISGKELNDTHPLNGESSPEPLSLGLLGSTPRSRLVDALLGLESPSTWNDGAAYIQVRRGTHRCVWHHSDRQRG
jgi:hypothetical protein